MKVAVSPEHAKTITLAETQRLFFAIDPASSSLKPQNPKDEPYQSRLLVYINSILVNMQSYAFNTLRR